MIWGDRRPASRASLHPGAEMWEGGREARTLRKNIESDGGVC